MIRSIDGVDYIAPSWAMGYGPWGWAIGHGQWAMIVRDRTSPAGTPRAVATGMKARNLEDVVVYREAIVAEDEVSAILERVIFGKDLNLKDQLDRSSSRIAPLISEGFAQLTDRHVATYLARAR